MKLAFAGTPEFAAVTLRRLLQTAHEIRAVYTQPDRPAGRGRKLTPGPVKQLALERGLVVRQPASLRGEEQHHALAGLELDALVVAAYGLILPRGVLDIPTYGCINVHASLLPRWRGAAPIQRAILAADTRTGVSIMQMDEGLDTGPVYTMRETPIDDRDTAGSLHDRLAGLGADLLVDVLDGLAAGTATASPQVDGGATYAARIDKSEARIDWTLDAATLDRKVRAFNPVPVAWTTLPPRGNDPPTRLRVFESRAHGPGGSRASPGEVICAEGDDLRVACGNGELSLAMVQPAGRKPIAAGQFIRARGIEPGERLG